MLFFSFPCAIFVISLCYFFRFLVLFFSFPCAIFFISLCYCFHFLVLFFFIFLCSFCACLFSLGEPPPNLTSGTLWFLVLILCLPLVLFLASALALLLLGNHFSFKKKSRCPGTELWVAQFFPGFVGLVCPDFLVSFFSFFGAICFLFWCYFFHFLVLFFTFPCAIFFISLCYFFHFLVLFFSFPCALFFISLCYFFHFLVLFFSFPCAIFFISLCYFFHFLVLFFSFPCAIIFISLCYFFHFLVLFFSFPCAIFFISLCSFCACLFSLGDLREWVVGGVWEWGSGWIMGCVSECGVGGCGERAGSVLCVWLGSCHEKVKTPNPELGVQFLNPKMINFLVLFF